MKIDNYSVYNNKEHRLVITKEFETRTELTPRILEVSEAFGLGVSEVKKFSIYKNFKIGFNPGEIIYITGDSGGGKSLLLTAIKDEIDSNPDTKINLSDIIPDNEEILIESIGSDLNEAVKTLSSVGLNDAFIFLRKYQELSDGQKYRYRLAKAINLGVEYLFIDEFCANLDRITAKVIAYNLQKVVRRTGVTLIVATTHDDLINDINPDVLVRKNFMNDVTVDYFNPVNRTISFYNDITVEQGTMNDYKQLAKYHYKNKKTNFPYSKIMVAKHKSNIVGVLVFSPPFLQTKGRTIKFDGKYSRMEKDVVAEINKYFTRVSRVVISPKYRGCGLGQKILLESMLSSGKKYIELVSVMSNYNPFADKIGMERIEITEETDAPTLKLFDWLEEKGLKEAEIHNPIYWNNFIENLSDEDKETLTRMTGKVLHHPKIGLSGKDGKRAEVVKKEKIYKEVEFNIVKDEIITYIPKLYTGNSLYYIWQNPRYVETANINNWL